MQTDASSHKANDKQFNESKAMATLPNKQPKDSKI